MKDSNREAKIEGSRRSSSKIENGKEEPECVNIYLHRLVSFGRGLVPESLPFVVRLDRARACS